MKKILKILAWVIGPVLGLLLVTVLAVSLVFDPNKYKGEIVQAVKTATGRELTIEGKLSWSLIPWLGVKTEGLTFGNARGFGPEPFAKVGAAGASVELLPLLIGHVRVNTLHMRDLTINLARDAKGRTNWDDLVSGTKTAPTEKPSQPEKHSSSAIPAGVVIGGVNVQRAAVNFRDSAQDAAYAVRDLELRTGRIATDAPIDVQLACTLQYDKPAKQAKLALRTALALSDKSVALRNLELKLDDSRLTGVFEIADLRKTALRFDLALDKIDLDRYLPAAPASGTGAAAARTTSTQQTNAPATDIPVATLRTLDAQGKLRIGSLKALGIRISDVLVQIAAHNGVTNLGPNEGKLYGGVWSGRSQFDARAAKARFNFGDELKNVQLGPLLKDAGVFDRFQGTGEIAWTLVNQGANTRELLQSLTGTVNVAARDGRIEGVNFAKLIADARRLYDQARGKAVAVATASSDETAFKSLHASDKIENGVALTDDLKLEGPVVRAEGGGTADLVRETLDYRLNVVVVEGEGRQGNALPVRIGGTFANPSYRVEFGEILKQKAEQQLEKKLNEKLDRLFRKREP